MMKRILFIIAALTAFLYLSAQGVFGGQDCHNLRSGDVVNIEIHNNNIIK